MGSSALSSNNIMATGTKLEDLSEGCISEILSRTTPLDACGAALVSKLFYSAAGSDSVWEGFMPSNHPHVIATSTTCPSSKKALFFCLCETPILIDQGTKTVRLDKVSGEKFYMIGARELSIAWQDEPEYWVWTSNLNSSSGLVYSFSDSFFSVLLFDTNRRSDDTASICRFNEIACLSNVFWFDIVGQLETRILSPGTTYFAYLVFKFDEHDYGLDQEFKSYVTLVGNKEDAGDQTHFRRVNFKAREYPRRQRINIWLSRERCDGWMEIEMGNFSAPAEGDEMTLVRMQVKEVEILGSKSGIIVKGIEVRPKTIRVSVH